MHISGSAARSVNATPGGPIRRRRRGLVGLVATSLLAQAVIASAIIPAVTAADAACGARPLAVEMINGNAVIACIDIVKTASVTELPAGGGDVTYTYDVSNLGNVTLDDIEVVDDKCAAVAYVSGDANTDELLDLAEVWHFSCTMNLTSTTTNVATATGTFDGATVEATAELTVTVAESTPDPSPDVTPDPSPDVTPDPSPDVTPEPTPDPTPEPTPEPTPDGFGMMVMFKFDDMGTEDIFDDEFLDGAWFTIYLDDDDGIYEDASQDVLVADAAPASGGFLETDMLPDGDYWIVESTVPDGYVGIEPIFIELNIDPEEVCFWDAGEMSCEEAFESDGIAYTGIFIENSPAEDPTPTQTPSATPSESPTGAVGGAEGTPRITLPPTDLVDGETIPTNTSSTGFLGVMALLGGLVAIAAIATPATARRRNRSDR